MARLGQAVAAAGLLVLSASCGSSSVGGGALGGTAGVGGGTGGTVGGGTGGTVGGTTGVGGGSGGTVGGGAGGTVGGTTGGGMGGSVSGTGGSPVGEGGAAGRGGCGTTDLSTTHQQVDVLLVLDESASMGDTPAGFSMNKWAALQSALETALTAAQNDLDYGLLTYPVDSACAVAPDATAVDVGIDAGATSVPLILGALSSATPAGGTPTAVALQATLDYFTNGAGADLPGDHVVLLVTDGGPTCNAQLTCGEATCTVNLDGRCPTGVTNCCGTPGTQDECLDAERTVSAVEALHTVGIDTYVVGIPGSEAYAATLARMAQAGGTTDYFAASASGDVAGLADVLTGITGELVTPCELQLASTPPDRQKINVEIDGVVVPADPVDGWTLDGSTEPPTVVLRGATCRRVQTEGVSAVNVTFGCPTQMAP